MSPAAAGVWVGPTPRPDLDAAVIAGGGQILPLPAAEAIVWTADEPELLRRSLRPGVRWVQLCAAGVELWLDAGVIDRKRLWTGAQGVASWTVAEHVVCLMLAAARELPRRIRASAWDEAGGRSLKGTHAGIIGAGGIGTAVARLAAELGVRTTAMTRTARFVPEADASVGPDQLDRVLRESDWVVIAAPATPATVGLIKAREFALMRSDAWLINVSRGSIVDTAALVDALDSGELAGAALDATDPEPLPAGHPLWGQPNVIITPHTATTPAMHASELATRVRENVTRFRAGLDLVGAVDLDRGY